MGDCFCLLYCEALGFFPQPRYGALLSFKSNTKVAIFLSLLIAHCKSKAISETFFCNFQVLSSLNKVRKLCWTFTVLPYALKWNYLLSRCFIKWLPILQRVIMKKCCNSGSLTYLHLTCCNFLLGNLWLAIYVEVAIEYYCFIVTLHLHTDHDMHISSSSNSVMSKWFLKI